jgi:hypothetical protein
MPQPTTEKSRIYGCSADAIAGRAANVHTLQAALEVAGAEFLNSDRPGIRLK